MLFNTYFPARKLNGPGLKADICISLLPVNVTVSKCFSTDSHISEKQKSISISSLQKRCSTDMVLHDILLKKQK